MGSFDPFIYRQEVKGGNYVLQNWSQTLRNKENDDQEKNN